MTLRPSIKRGNLKLAGVLATVSAVAMTGFASTGASADTASKASGPATISMELKGKSLFFDGPASVQSGGELQIVNNTDPKEIGPHTFSLVKQNLIPALTKEELKGCFKDGICLQVLKAHRVDFKTEEVGRRLVRSGAEGWDKSFGKRGDSWVALNQDDTFSQKVSAKPGTTLYYMCTIHPEMQGKIKVK